MDVQILNPQWLGEALVSTGSLWIPNCESPHSPYTRENMFNRLEKHEEAYRYGNLTKDLDVRGGPAEKLEKFNSAQYYHEINKFYHDAHM